MKLCCKFQSLFCGTLLIASTANAVLEEQDLKIGSGDGLITRDSETLLDWLDINYTQNSSYNSVYAPGGLAESGGWRHATFQEVLDLLETHTGFEHIIVHQSWEEPAPQEFLDAVDLQGVLGPTEIENVSVCTRTFVKGLLSELAVPNFSFGHGQFITRICESTGGNPHQVYFSVVSEVNGLEPDEEYSTIGHWLVRPTQFQPVISIGEQEISFSPTSLGEQEFHVLSIQNIGNFPLENLAIDDANQLEAPFFIDVDSCSGQVLDATETCGLTLRFQPFVEGSFADSFEITSNDPNFPSVGIMVYGDTLPVDSDGDAIPDSLDNCTLEPNPDQRDTDSDDIGNLCDADFNQDCFVNFIDLNIMSESFFVEGDLITDLDGDGRTSFSDLGIMSAFIFSPPGPSGVNNSCADTD